MKIRYYTTRQADPDSKCWGYWAPCLKRRSKKSGLIEPTTMAKLGFEEIACGEDGPEAWAIAETWNARWDAARRSGQPLNASGLQIEHEKTYPPSSLGHAFQRFKRTATWETGKKPRTREDWERGWKHIEPIFGDVNPRTVSLEDIDLFYGGDPTDPKIKGILELLGVRESHRVMKIWRALWRVAGSMKYCDREADPSLSIRRKTPKARNAMWFEGEAVRLVKAAWRMEFYGLAAALATSWDTMMSPVDVRSLSLAQLRGDAQGHMFDVDRAKTGKAAIGTLSIRTSRVLAAYIESLPFTLHPDTPIFHTRGAEPGPQGGRPHPPALYTRFTLAKDFRIVREAVFPGDTRKISDFRRSGAVEAAAGEVAPTALAGKMASTINRAEALQNTYLPHNTTLVRLADRARELGRSRLRGSGTKGKDV